MPGLVPLSEIILKEPCLVSAKGRRHPTRLDIKALAGSVESHVGGVDVVSCIRRDSLLSIWRMSNVDPSAWHLRPGYMDGDAIPSLERVIPRTSRWRNPRAKSHQGRTPTCCIGRLILRFGSFEYSQSRPRQREVRLMERVSSVTVLCFSHITRAVRFLPATRRDPIGQPPLPE